MKQTWIMIHKKNDMIKFIIICSALKLVCYWIKLPTVYSWKLVAFYMSDTNDITLSFVGVTIQKCCVTMWKIICDRQ